MHSRSLTNRVVQKVRRRARQARKLVHALPNATRRRGIASGTFSSRSHESVITRFAPMTVIDVGANGGQFSLSARLAQPTARIIAFEPLQGPSTRFRQLFATDEKVSLTTVALGSEPGVAEIHVSSLGHSSSLLPIGPNQTSRYPGSETSRTEEVVVSTLDHEIDGHTLTHPVLLKLDVQGFELEVLGGAQATLEQVDVIVAECSFEELYVGQPLAPALVRWLDARQFELRGISDTSKVDGTIVQADLVFCRLSDERPSP